MRRSRCESMGWNAMDLGLKERVALVTGGSHGIGAAIAVALGEEGARVALTYHSRADRAMEVVERVEAVGGHGLALPLDLADYASIDGAVAAIGERWGGLDTLIVNAVDRTGNLGPLGVRFEDVDPVWWQQALRNNLEGAFATVRAALPAMRGRTDGRIVFISSGIAEEGASRAWAYASAKSGLVGLARSLAWELGSEGIFVNVIAVGMTLTENANAVRSSEVVDRGTAASITRRLSTPEDVANLVTYFASPANRSVSGEVIREGTSTTRSTHGAIFA